MKIVLGVTGGIAAYKAALLLRLMTEDGHDVRVIPTASALKFVGAPTWEALSHHPVTHEVFDDVDQVQHVRIGQEADLIVIAPATADFLSRAAAGRADDLLTTTLLATRAPVVMAPAMHTEMWENPAVSANVKTLREHGVHIVEPAVGRLTGTDTGAGRLPEPAEIYAQALAALSSSSLVPPSPEGECWSGREVVVTLGGTREALDPVRYLGNRSTGKQGLAVAQALVEAGARVNIIAGAVEVPLPDAESSGFASVERIESALELQGSLQRWLPRSDAIFMVAAVADFRPAVRSGTKIKKRADGQDPVIELIRNPDILQGLSEQREQMRRSGERGPLLIGFAAETGDEHGTVAEYGRRKLETKGIDAIAINKVSVTEGFGADTNTLEIVTAGADEAVEGSGTKLEAARVLVERAASLLIESIR